MQSTKYGACEDVTVQEAAGHATYRRKWPRCWRHRDRVLDPTKTMESNTSPDLKGSGLAEQDAKEAGVFGIDQKSRKHRWHKGTATVVVTHDDEIVHTEELAREHVTQWIEFVRDDACGWIDVWWSSEKFGDGLFRMEEVVRTADELVCDGGQEQ